MQQLKPSPSLLFESHKVSKILEKKQERAILWTEEGGTSGKKRTYHNATCRSTSLNCAFGPGSPGAPRISSVCWNAPGSKRKPARVIVKKKCARRVEDMSSGVSTNSCMYSSATPLFLNMLIKFLNPRLLPRLVSEVEFCWVGEDIEGWEWDNA